MLVSTTWRQRRETLGTRLGAQRLAVNCKSSFLLLSQPALTLGETISPQFN